MARNCPNCSTLTTPQSAHGVEFEECSVCGGIWLPGNELKELIASDQKTIGDIEANVHPDVDHLKLGASQLSCPDDHSVMDQYHYLYNSPVMVHACNTCGGVFIHAQDLPLMQQWFQKSQGPITPDESLKAAMALDVAKHEQFMARQTMLQGFFGTLSMRVPGWIGLL